MRRTARGEVYDPQTGADKNPSCKRAELAHPFTLRLHDVVGLDNPIAHYRPIVEMLIRSRKAQFLFLPPYSPDRNPIESCWLKVKTRLRSIGARTLATHIQVMREALATAWPQDAAAWFAYCGFPH